MPDHAARRLPIGAEVVAGGVDFRVWAPRARRVEVLVEGREAVALGPSSESGTGAHVGGHFGGVVAGIGAGARCRFVVDGGSPVPDPASRFQPDGPHGPSEVIDPGGFTWSDTAWRGVALADAVIYELHVGTSTRDGTFAAAAEHLPDLADLGVTVVELMPIADFPGNFGWGYDGVDLFAPTRLYGRPDDLRAFVDRAHALGIGVILDVVYNHFGPDGWYLAEFAETYVSRRHSSEWGETPNFDEAGSEGVREFVLANVRAWIEEYHLDGLRLDATQQIFDDSPEHVLAEIARTVRDSAGPKRRLVVAENEPQDARLVRSPAAGGYGLDAIWNDDLHHAAIVALTGLREAYYSDYRGAPQEFVSAATNGFLFQGQYHAWQRARRGSPAFDLRPGARVNFLANHDQVANAKWSERLPSPAASGRIRAMTAFVLLCPGTPMLPMRPASWSSRCPTTQPDARWRSRRSGRSTVPEPPRPTGFGRSSSRRKPSARRPAIGRPTWPATCATSTSWWPSGPPSTRRSRASHS